MHRKPRDVIPPYPCAMAPGGWVGDWAWGGIEWSVAGWSRQGRGLDRSDASPMRNTGMSSHQAGTDNPTPKRATQAPRRWEGGRASGLRAGGQAGGGRAVGGDRRAGMPRQTTPPWVKRGTNTTPWPTCLPMAFGDKAGRRAQRSTRDKCAKWPAPHEDIAFARTCAITRT